MRKAKVERDPLFSPTLSFQFMSPYSLEEAKLRLRDSAGLHGSPWQRQRLQVDLFAIDDHTCKFQIAQRAGINPEIEASGHLTFEDDATTFVSGQARISDEMYSIVLVCALVGYWILRSGHPLWFLQAIVVLGAIAGTFWFSLITARRDLMELIYSSLIA